MKDVTCSLKIIFLKSAESIQLFDRGSHHWSVDPPTLMSLGGHVAMFRNKTTLEMSAELIIQFSDHAHYKDMSYQGIYMIDCRTLLRVVIKDPDG